jgi:hypothetical protein
MKFYFSIKIIFLIMFFAFNSFISTIAKSLLSITSNSRLKVNQPFSTVEKFKFLFMFKLPSVKNDKDHPLNILSYKNVLLSTSQIVYFVSQNTLSSVRIIKIYISKVAGRRHLGYFSLYFHNALRLFRFALFKPIIHLHTQPICQGV